MAGCPDPLAGDAPAAGMRRACRPTASFCAGRWRPAGVLSGGDGSLFVLGLEVITFVSVTAVVLMLTRSLNNVLSHVIINYYQQEMNGYLTYY